MEIEFYDAEHSFFQDTVSGKNSQQEAFQESPEKSSPEDMKERMNQLEKLKQDLQRKKLQKQTEETSKSSQKEKVQ